MLFSSLPNPAFNKHSAITFWRPIANCNNQIVFKALIETYFKNLLTYYALELNKLQLILL